MDEFIDNQITVLSKHIVATLHEEGDYYTDLLDEELAAKIDTLIRKGLFRLEVEKSESPEFDVFWGCASEITKIEGLDLEASDMQEIVKVLKKHFNNNPYAE